MPPTTRFKLPPEGTSAFRVAMLAANDAVRGLAALEQIPAEADAALADAAQCKGFPADIVSSAGYAEARAVRNAVREQTAALRHDVTELLADAKLTFEQAHPEAPAPARMEPTMTRAPRPRPGTDELAALESAGFVVRVVRWKAGLTTHNLGAVDDAITRLESVLDAHDPQNVALLECLHRFVEGTRGGTGW